MRSKGINDPIRKFGGREVLRPCVGSPTDLCGPVRCLQVPLNLAGQFSVVAEGSKESVLFGGNDLGRAGGIAGDDGEAERHRFNHHEAKGLTVGSVHEDVEGRHPGGGIGLESGHDNSVGQSQPVNLLAQAGRVLWLIVVLPSDNDPSDVGMCFAQAGNRIDEYVHSLPVLQATHHAYDRRINWKTQLSTTIGLRAVGGRIETGEVNPRVDDLCRARRPKLFLLLYCTCAGAREDALCRNEGCEPVQPVDIGR
jgi:hypothetical protein